jgi:NAD-dependent dihydropyrimidine dehydrogenase PreA subunit
MCEFCIQHGEGKKWYLEMKNYSDILLYEKLSAEQKEISGFNSRPEFMEDTLVNYMMPAMAAIPKQPQDAVAEEEEPVTDEADPPAEPEVEYTAEEIVNRKKITHFGQVIPIEDVDAVLDRASSITRFPCGCRYLSTGKTDKRYCFGFGRDETGILGKYPEASSSLEVLEKDEAKEIFHKYDQEGLMHSVWTCITPYVSGLCNCDRDCRAYNYGYVEGSPSSFFRAEYICQVDWDQCIGCKDCVSQCQFGALHYSSTLSKVYIHPKMCFGCGVCRAACSYDAISLQSRQEHEIAQDYWLAREL